MSRGNTVKIFIGNVAEDTTPDKLRPLFEKYGEVVECDVLKNYGFVHMTNKNDANKAIAQLDGYSVDNHNIRVELSTGKKGGGGGGKFDRRGFGGGGGGPRRGGPYSHPRDFRDMDRFGLGPSPYERYDYYRMLMERERMFGMSPLDRAGARDRYPLPLPRDRMGDRYPPDPRDRLARSFLEERAARLQDPYMRERDPISARPPPEYYDRKPAGLGGLRGADSLGGVAGRSSGFGGAGDFLRGMDRGAGVGGLGSGAGDFLGRANQGSFNRQNGPMGGGKSDSQSSFATDAIFF